MLFIGAGISSSMSSNIKQFDRTIYEKYNNLMDFNSDIPTQIFYPTDVAYIDRNNPDSPYGSSKDIKVKNSYISESSKTYEMNGLIKF